MKNIFMVALLGIVLAAVPAISSAGYLHPSVTYQFRDNPELVYHPVIVSLEEQADIESIDAELKQRKVSRKVRHEIIIRALQDAALRSQADFETELEKALQAGGVRSYESLWLINAFRVEAAKEFIEELARRDDVKDIVPDFVIEELEGVSKSDFRQGERHGIEPNLEVINAPEAWARGYTGEGTLVAQLTTGVMGTHPALADKWRGLDPRYDEHPEWAWFDPITYTTFPFDDNGHGTFTTGVSVGADHNTGDTIGVALDGEWMAAAVINRADIPTTLFYALLSLQWCADPDGNPETVWDVPDACSNSWGLSPIYHGAYTYPCDPYLWEAIDNAEAAGCAVLWAAGADGPMGETIRVPADRGDNAYQNFAVSVVDGNQSGYPLAPFASRGPSTCAPDSIKPEVVAPGIAIRSSSNNGGYVIWDGTSPGAPAVAGAMMILREAVPNATVEELKEALMATALDLGDTGDDNLYGMGLIDIDAALDWILELYECAQIMMVPDDDPITVPPGGNFGLTGFVGNTSDDTMYVDVWVGVKYAGSFYELHSFNNIQLYPTQWLQAHLNQTVPNYAPSGTYEYIAYCGDKPNACDSAMFHFTVSGAKTVDPASEWTLEGSWGDEDGDNHQYSEDIECFAYPNPFNNKVNITFKLSSADNVEIDIYNLLGQKIETLANRNYPSGFHTVTWDASDYSSGVYFYRLHSKQMEITRRVQLIK